MIIDFKNGDCPTHIEADLCIFGAGAAGLAIAREFLGTPLQVCVAESGGLAGAECDQALYQGASIGNPELDPASGRMRAFGGSCNLWGGGCIPLDGFASREWVEGSGWPLTHADLEPYYRRALSFCQLDGQAMAEATFSGRPQREPLAFDPDVLSNQISAISPILPGEAYLREFEQAPNVRVLLHANLMELETGSDGRSVLAARLASLNGQAARVRARQYVLACGGIENARLLLLSDSMVPGGLGNRNDLVGRYFMDHPSGRLGTIITDAPDRLTRPYSWLPSGDAPPVHPEICLSVHAQREHRTLGARVRPFAVEENVPKGIRALRELRAALHPPRPDEDAALRQRLSTRNNGEPGILHTPVPAEGLPRLALRTALGASDIVRAMIRKAGGRTTIASRRIDLIGYFEQAPNPDSRITLGEELDVMGQRKVCVDWRLTALDRHTYRTAAMLFGTQLANACGGTFQIAPWLGQEESEALAVTGTAHHLGTTRMSDDPAAGVVDRDCRVNDVDNLFVAGSSVFPAGGWAFPTFTIVALALRLAEHLHGRLASSVDALDAPAAVAPIGKRVAVETG